LPVGAGTRYFWRGWARSSAVEHCLDTAGATGSIPVAPTILLRGLEPGVVSHRVVQELRVIPAALMNDPCPGAMRDGLDALRVADEKVPSIFARGDDCFVAVPNQPTELVAAEIIPDVLHWVELR
jgi:hypothetical protein